MYDFVKIKINSRGSVIVDANDMKALLDKCYEYALDGLPGLETVEELVYNTTTLYLKSAKRIPQIQ